MVNFNDYFNHVGKDLIWKRATSNRVKVGDVAGWKDEHGYVYIRFMGKLRQAHRIIWEMHHGPIPEGMEIDHINHVTDDNRIENLRLVTRKENCKNVSMSVTNKSGVVGVSWCKRTGKWFASIRVDKRELFLGRYEDKNEAISARKAAEVKYNFHKNHGDKK